MAEIVSPSTQSRDDLLKLNKYQDAGVRDTGFWIRFWETWRWIFQNLGCRNHRINAGLRKQNEKVPKPSHDNLVKLMNNNK